MNKIKINVNISIKNDESGKKTVKSKIMSLASFADMMGDDEPSEYDDIPCDEKWPEWILGHLLLNSKISYTTSTDVGEKSVEAKLLNLKEALCVLRLKV